MECIITLLTMVVVGLLCFGLYNNGYMTINCHKAMKFIARKKGLTASFTYCNGFLKRAMIFTNIQPREFDFYPEITGGEIVVEIMNKSKNVYVLLDVIHRHGAFTPELGAKYYSKVTFGKASGSYNIEMK